MGKKGETEKRGWGEGAGGRKRKHDALFVEYGDHPRRQGVVRNLRDLQELVAVY